MERGCLRSYLRVFSCPDDPNAARSVPFLDPNARPLDDVEVYETDEVRLLRFPLILLSAISCVFPVWSLLGRSGDGDRERDVDIDETDADERSDLDTDRSVAVL